MFAVDNIVTRRPPVRPPNGTRPASAPHPSEGGSRGYAQEMRDQVILLWMNGEDLNAMWIELLRHQRKFPCLRTCRRWIRQYQGEGHTRHMRPTGNCFSEREVRGQDLVNCAVFELFDPRPTSTKSVHMCTIAILQIRHILDHRLVEPS
jgi:hypothetical protein